MATADESDPPRTYRTLKVDAHGHAVKMTPEEQREYAERARAGLARMATIESSPDEDDWEFFRAMDEAYPGRFNLVKFVTDGNNPP